MKVVVVYVMDEKGTLGMENKGAFHGNLKSKEVQTVHSENLFNLIKILEQYL